MRSAATDLVYDVPRLLDEREALRAELWRIAFRAERAQAEDDPRALAEIEEWAMEALAAKSREEYEVSTLDEILRAYLRSKGFHPTGRDGSDKYGWGHPELGEGRTFMQCVEWQIGREQASAAETMEALHVAQP